MGLFYLLGDVLCVSEFSGLMGGVRCLYILIR